MVASKVPSMEVVGNRRWDESALSFDYAKCCRRSHEGFLFCAVILRVISILSPPRHKGLKVYKKERTSQMSRTINSQFYQFPSNSFPNYKLHVMKMQLLTRTSALAFALLTAAAEATPIASRTPSSASILFSRDSINDCGGSTFVDESSGGSPLISDCRQIATNIAGGGSWEVENFLAQQHQLVQSGTCAFGVQGDGEAEDDGFYVGNQDIIDLINSSIADLYVFVSFFFLGGEGGQGN